MYEITGVTIGRKNRFYIEVLDVQNRVAKVAVIHPDLDLPVAHADVFEDGEYLRCHFTNPPQGYDVTKKMVLDICDCQKFFKLLEA